MLRITIVNGRGGGQAPLTTLKLEGKLLQPWLHDLHASVARARHAGERVRLDLSDVQFIDAAGERALVALLARDGIELGACSSFVVELLQVGKR